ncbi:DoxX family protein [Actinomycetes bacterium KLBMP 9759]
MRVAVWIVSVLLALAFLFIGGTKVLMPVADMAAGSHGIPVVLLKIAGVAEVLGAVGLVLPAATRIMPVLTPVAAAGLTLTMVGATAIDIGLGIYALAAQTAVLGLLAAFVAWARFGPAAIAPRGQAAVRSRDAAPSA